MHTLSHFLSSYTASGSAGNHDDRKFLCCLQWAMGCAGMGWNYPSLSLCCAAHSNKVGLKWKWMKISVWAEVWGSGRWPPCVCVYSLKCRHPLMSISHSAEFCARGDTTTYNRAERKTPALWILSLRAIEPRRKNFGIFIKRFHPGMPFRQAPGTRPTTVVVE